MLLRWIRSFMEVLAISLHGVGVRYPILIILKMSSFTLRFFILMYLCESGLHVCVWSPEEARSYSTTLPYSLETEFLKKPGPRLAASSQHQCLDYMCARCHAWLFTRVLRSQLGCTC